MRILEPAESAVVSDFDCVLTPLVAFDDRGFRLGMGGGYYDRYFARTDTLLIGVAFACQRSEAPLPSETWDVHLDAIVTEQGILEFTR